MNYYYAVNGNQTGPVSEEELRQMVAAGSLPTQTPVWREGMPEWQPFSVALGGGAQAAVECSVCHQTFPADQTIKYGTVNVCAACKPRFMQGLREGAATSGVILDYVGFGPRFAAKILDYIVIYIVQMGVNFVLVGSPWGVTSPNQATVPLIALSSLLGFLIPFTYQAVFLHWRGQTLGKMALKIQVVTPDGGPLSWGKCIGRPLAEILSGCIIFIGYLMVIWDPEKRALHDRLAGTRVIKVAK